MIFSNYHTHTIYCDGKNDAETIVNEAIKCGCPEVGFSGHSYTFFDTSYCMSIEDTQKYKEEILFLKEKYKDKIKILLGIEQDYFSQEDTKDYDFVIGSVHYVYKNGKYLDVDNTKDIQKNIVNTYYDGDFYEFVKDYYALAGDVYNKTKCDIIGHFDLVTKFNADNDLFDVNDKRYIQYSRNALSKLLKTKAAFEINTGAIARGLRTTPYPEKSMVDIIKKGSGKLILSSDCHDAENLLFGFDRYKEWLK